MAVIRDEDLSWEDGPPGGSRFGSRYRRFGQAAGGVKLGCSLYEVQPGKMAFAEACALILRGQTLL